MAFQIVFDLFLSQNTFQKATATDWTSESSRVVSSAYYESFTAVFMFIYCNTFHFFRASNALGE